MNSSSKALIEGVLREDKKKAKGQNRNKMSLPGEREIMIT